MVRLTLPAVPLSGSQLATVILGGTFLGAAVARTLAAAAGMPHETPPYLAQLVTFCLGAAALLCAPALQRRAAALLRTRVQSNRYADVALAIIVSALGEFALFGLDATLKWFAGGDAAVAAMQSSPAHSLDSAFHAATLRDLVIGCLMAPLLEETFYRGLLFEAWARERSVAAALILSSVVFMLVHPTWIHAFFGGLLLCAVYVRTGSLRASILVHFCANAFNWYPLLGQFLIPSHNQGIRSWTFQLVCLATAPLFVIGYAWLATQTRRPLGDGETCPAAA